MKDTGNEFGKFLNKFGIESKSARVKLKGKHVRKRYFPTLEECRKTFHKEFKFHPKNFNWDDEVTQTNIDTN